MWEAVGGKRGTSAILSTIHFFNPVTLSAITFIKHRKLYLELDNAGKPLTNSLIKKSMSPLHYVVAALGAGGR